MNETKLNVLIMVSCMCGWFSALYAVPWGGKELGKFELLTFIYFAHSVAFGMFTKALYLKIEKHINSYVEIYLNQEDAEKCVFNPNVFIYIASLLYAVNISFILSTIFQGKYANLEHLTTFADLHLFSWEFLVIALIVSLIPYLVIYFYFVFAIAIGSLVCLIRMMKNRKR